DKSYIKLNTNESPFPPAKGVTLAAKEQAGKLNLYSDPTCLPLKRAAADLYGLQTENVLCGNGSDEVLFFTFLAFCSESKGMACPDVSYGFYPVLCSLLNIPYIPVPLAADFTINVQDYAAINANICIANPNAQTGVYLPLCRVEELVRQNADRIVVVDEAYIDFGGDSAVKLINKYGNLIVVQTMSKSRSLAGGRVGFAFADKNLICDLEAVRNSFNPYNVNRMSMFAAEQSLKDKDYFLYCTKNIMQTRQFTTEQLRKLGFTVLPSMANFVLAKTDVMGGRQLYLKLKQRGILVRHLNDDRIKDFVRITIGSAEQMAVFIETLKDILKETV
ncbi:MAG: aminotransferase class I/II-fold pyridoxal phosphate-dependent enzyme, partial [Clostridia bacterium]|nr:aminotransferase class I/II-fold pyridoxal phosphate-dependent enzyme [Clostridia bacterium]